MSRKNYRRGFGRLYVVGSSIWLLVIWIIGSGSKRWEGGAFVDNPWEGKPLAFLALAIIPPLIGYGFFFWVVPWIARGFRSAEK